MALRLDALDELEYIISELFYDVEKFEPYNRNVTLQSLYRAVDNQLQDGLIRDYSYNRYRYYIQKLWDLKLQIYKYRYELTLDTVDHIIGLILDLYSEGLITKTLFIGVCARLHNVNGTIDI